MDRQHTKQSDYSSRLKTARKFKRSCTKHDTNVINEVINALQYANA